MVDTGLAGRVALVTGANNPLGIGVAIAKALSCEGARVFATFLRTASGPAEPPAEPGMALYEAMQTRLPEFRDAWEADLRDPSNVNAVFDRAEACHGPVEILVNNAAHCDRADSTETITSAAIDRTFEVNVRASMLLIAEFARRHRGRGAHWGRIINLSTDAAQNFPTQISYGASKAAIEALTRAVASELGPAGITVNAIAPGPIQTGYISPALEQQLLPAIPLRRLGAPEDIADAVVFLASHQARWITGQVIRVSGGHIM